MLVVADPDPGEPGLVEALRIRGFEVETRETFQAGVDLLNGDGADVAVLALPLPGPDVAGMCAALKDTAWAPIVILADGDGQVGATTEALPESLRPEAIFTRPIDAGKLTIEMHEHLRALDFTDDPDAPAVGVTVPELLLELERQQESVVLEVRSDGVRTAIHLRDGQPVFAGGRNAAGDARSPAPPARRDRPGPVRRAGEAPDGRPLHPRVGSHG